MEITLSLLNHLFVNDDNEAQVKLENWIANTLELQLQEKIVEIQWACERDPILELDGPYVIHVLFSDGTSLKKDDDMFNCYILFDVVSDMIITLLHDGCYTWKRGQKGLLKY